MSLDNVVGVAAAAKGNVPLLVFGLVISIPLIIFGSTLILKLMERFPVIIVLGAALLGWVAGEMAMSRSGHRRLGRQSARAAHGGPCARRHARWWRSASG